MRHSKGIKSANRYQKACALSQISIKAVDGDSQSATVTGYASTFDRTPDSYGDIVAPGAFSESLARWASLNEQGKYIPFCITAYRRFASISVLLEPSADREDC